MAQETIESKWDSLRDKYCELDLLRAKLERSMAIQKLWNEAFAFGGCKTYFKGGSITFASRYHEVQFVIENANGETKTFNTIDVPEILIERLVRVQQDKSNCRETYNAIESYFRWYKQLRKRKEQLK
jgi:hypothetical protein